MGTESLKWLTFKVMLVVEGTGHLIMKTLENDIRTHSPK